MTRALGPRWRALAATAVCVLAAVGIFATPAAAVSTTDLTLSPQAVHGLTPAVIVVHAGEKTTAVVELTNRTGHELAVLLGKQPAKSAGGRISLGGPVTGVVSHLSLANGSLKLRPHQRLPVDITVNVPRAMTGYAVVTAAAQPSVANGGVSVVERLAVLIQVKGPTGPPPTPKSSPLPYVIAAIVVVVLILLALLDRRRRRRGQPGRRPAEAHHVGAPRSAGSPSPAES
jgi:hypothetical protein